MNKRRHRRTKEEITQAIHAAVISQVKAKGFDGLTFEGVARRCRTSKSVVYRRYKNRADMYLDAIGSTMIGLTFPQPTGSLRDDLIAWFKVYQKAWFAAPAAYRGLIGEANTETLARVAAFETSAAALLMEGILRPAIIRGDLGCLPLHPEVVQVPLRVLRDRFIFNAGKIDIVWFVDKIAVPLLKATTGWNATWKRIRDRRLLKENPK